MPTERAASCPLLDAGLVEPMAAFCAQQIPKGTRERDHVLQADPAHDDLAANGVCSLVERQEAWVRGAGGLRHDLGVRRAPSRLLPPRAPTPRPGAGGLRHGRWVRGAAGDHLVVVRLDARAAAEAENLEKRRLCRDVVVGQRGTVFQLLARVDQTLMPDRDVIRVLLLDLGLEAVDRVSGVGVDRDGLA